MRIFRFWRQIERTIRIDGRPLALHCFGGSNVSVEDAQRDAQARLDRVIRKVTERVASSETYEADIREPILARLDDRNIVTRNRYGAEVLNSTEVMFVDIDEPPMRLWDLFVPARTPQQRKDRMVAHVRRQMDRAEFRALGIRLYETPRGIRAIVVGRDFDPMAADTRRLLRLLNADRLYAALCHRQGCFRARLTPKPHRIKLHAIKVRHPAADAAEEARIASWVENYNRARVNYSACRFIGTCGLDMGNAAIEYHDRATGAHAGKRLA